MRGISSRFAAISVVVLIYLFTDLLAVGETTKKDQTTFVFDSTLYVENDVEIKTRLTGIIDEIFVDRGASVKKGTPLAKLENEDLSLEMEKAKANKELHEVEFKRAKSLHEQQLLSESEYDGKRIAFERASAESELARVNYEKSIIRAPFSGIVVERQAKLGQRVVEDEDLSLFRITAMEPLLARIFVAEEKIAQISPGMKAEFVSTINSAVRHLASVKWISSITDSASGMSSVIVQIKPTGQQKNNLRPGMSGKVYVFVKAK